MLVSGRPLSTAFHAIRKDKEKEKKKETRSSWHYYLGARRLLVAPGIATRNNNKLLWALLALLLGTRSY